MTNPVNPFGSVSWPSYDLDAPSPPSQPQPQPQPGFNPNYAGPHASEYFEDPGHQEYFLMTKKSLIQQHLMIGRSGPSWTENDEIKLVNKLHNDWFGEPYQEANDWTTNLLDLSKLKTVQLRRRPLAPFKIKYQTLPEIKLRLQATAIAIKGNPFYVNKVKQKSGKFYLQVYDAEDNMSAVNFDDLDDLRTIPSMYLSSTKTGWMSRSPGRVFQQGLNRGNTSLWSVDGHTILLNPDPHRLVKEISKRSNRIWNETFSSLVKSNEVSTLRLSDDLAVIHRDGEITACYRGRVLGEIKDNEVFVEDEDDIHQEWIVRATKEVGLDLAA